MLRAVVFMRVGAGKRLFFSSKSEPFCFIGDFFFKSSMLSHSTTNYGAWMRGGMLQSG
jgi:hypothetical protein